MKWKAKVDWWASVLFLVFLLIPAWLIYQYICLPSVITIISMLFFFLLDILVCLPLYFATYYVIGEQSLSLHAGFYCHQNIPYEAVVKAELIRDHTVFSHTTQRLKITYRKGKKLEAAYLTPKNKADFLARLSEKLPIAIAYSDEVTA